ncbi:NACHT, LRR and PYD domains-containing protein 3 isoform X3 [Astyanax mexicanus]|uniref:NACHT, LRR and PYD domains-containing protein 3 isoform X3 n=1 Tax=Astyanax mexicanus TaxID=7994 RepID=UPI0020CADE4D|nr:NACHT, LRR and PYD domains-containing protein 3 isoform X3 [Astyanax mexicanus]
MEEKERVASSGMDLCREVDEKDGDGQNQPRTSVSPEPSCVSMKSDRSMPIPPMFGEKDVSTNQRDDPEKSVYPEHSCASMRSDRSMPIPPMFRDKDVSSDQRDKPQKRKSPEPSHVSMRSDRSMPIPPMFSADDVSSDGRDKPKRSVSPEPSSVSLKSDRSMPIPPMFSGNVQPERSRDWCRLCKQLLKDPVSITCGHYFCMKCISNYWDNSNPSGGFLCPQCRKRSKTRPALRPQKAHDDFKPQVDDDVCGVVMKHKANMKKKYEYLYEGNRSPKKRVHLNIVYTQLYIIEADRQGMNEEHEVLRVESRSQDIPINCNDIFKHCEENVFKWDAKEKHVDMKVTTGAREKNKIKTVLTKGIAGIGKTVSVQKFILDWTEGTANQDVDFMFVLPFRELNLIRDEQYTLHEILCAFYPEIKDLEPHIYDQQNAVFIFDGLDESRIPLKFSGIRRVSDINTSSSVSVLMSKLIQGELLPSAKVWITSRPTAADQIPSEYVNRVTEIQGFNDQQKQEYFRKRITDKEQARRIISHIKMTKSLYVMCYIPVFSWISATVLQILDQSGAAEIPKTLTEMYAHFLLTQTAMKDEKYNVRNESWKEVILKLAQLAFKQLMKGNSMFYEEDLKECDIDVTEASVYSGICTEIFQEETVLYQKKIFCFVHLSFQEFMAALYVFYCYLNKNMEVLHIFEVALRGRQCSGQSKQQENWSGGVQLEKLLKGAVYKALETPNGQLNLFLRFLLGISLESSQRLLQELLMSREWNADSISRTSQFIKDQIQKEDLPAERSVSLFLCLLEMNDQSLYKEIQEYLKLEKRCEKRLTPIQCSALACMLLMSVEELDELDLKKYNTSREGCRRLVQAVGNCRKALISSSNLTAQCFETVSSVLQLPNSPLKELDLSNNDLQDSGAELLCAGLRSSHCKLEILRLAICKLSEKSCETLASVLQSENQGLRDLDLSNNDFQDSGLELLSAGLESSHCKLQVLRLSGCLITDEGCSPLASALKSNPCHLRELDLSYNKLRESGVKILSDLQKDPHYKLETLIVAPVLDLIKPGLQKYFCRLSLNLNSACRSLTVMAGNRTVSYQMENPRPYPEDPERFEYWEQVLCAEHMCGRCYWELEWSGEVAVAVSYKGITRKGRSHDCVFGHNEKSWRLSCSNISYSIKHNQKSLDITESPSRSDRVGVYLDWPSGTLSFYSVSEDTNSLTHLHTFHAEFTEPLYAGIGLYNYYSTATLCQTEQPDDL